MYWFGFRRNRQNCPNRPAGPSAGLRGLEASPFPRLRCGSWPGLPVRVALRSRGPRKGQGLSRPNLSLSYFRPPSRTESLAKRDSVPQDESMTFPYFTSHKVFRSALLFLFLLAVLTTSSGKSVKMITSWFNANYQGQTFHKILDTGGAQKSLRSAVFEQ